MITHLLPFFFVSSPYEPLVTSVHPALLAPSLSFFFFSFLVPLQPLRLACSIFMAALFPARLVFRIIDKDLTYVAGSLCDVTLWMVSSRCMRGRGFGVDEDACLTGAKPPCRY